MSENNFIETDILCIGAGVASLTTALSLLRKLKASNASTLPRVLILEKGRSVGSHVLSGAVIDPAGFEGVLTPEEIAEMEKRYVPAKVKSESFKMLFKNSAFTIPWMPPMMHAEGFPVGSLTKLTCYLAQLCEKEGAEIYTGFAAVKLIEDANGRVIGTKVGDKGVDKNGNPKENFCGGEEIHAKVVVLGEGPCGILTDSLLKRKNAGGSRPQNYAVAVKEIIEVPAKPDRTGVIMHTFGYPAEGKSYGGGFIYHVASNQVMVGYVYALDTINPQDSVHNLFLKYKAHPAIQEHIAGGKAVAYGAKMIPEGGFYAIPKLALDGVLIVGDGGGLLDSLRIKGVHLSMISGRIAGSTLADCWLKQDFSSRKLADYAEGMRQSVVWKQLKRVKNVRASFALGTIPGIVAAGLAWATGGAIPFWQMGLEEDYKAVKPLAQFAKRTEKIENTPLSMDILTDVFLSGTRHEEDQPCHLVIKDPDLCIKECLPKFGAPCQYFCSAKVYSIEDGKLKVDFSNCLHCKTCQIRDPYKNIEWKFPQGGDGPRYTRM